MYSLLTTDNGRSAPGGGDPGHLVTLVQLTHVLLNTHNTGGGPLLVHCSAGVGRTGTFISVDQICNNIDTKPGPDLDIFNTVYKLRKQRYNTECIQRTRGQTFLILVFRVHMVQTREQYEFLYKCVLHYLELKQKQKKFADNLNPHTAVSIL